MSDETNKAARVVASDLLNAISEGLDIASTVDSVVHKVAAVGGALDTVIEKYELDSGQVAALAVLMGEVPLVEPVDIDYAAIEKRIAAEWYGSVTGRSMELNNGLSFMVSGGLNSWRAAQAIYSMVSDQAREGVDAYFEEHGVSPIDGDPEKPWSANAIVAALLAHATYDHEIEPQILAAQLGNLAFMALVRYSEELSAMDAPPDGFVNMAHLGESPTGRNPSEPEQQQIPGNPLLQNPGFRMEGTKTGRLQPGPNLSNLPKELTEATTPDDAATAQCMKCHKQVVIKNLNVTTQGNGSRMARGVCPDCGTKVSKFLKKEKA